MSLGSKGRRIKCVCAYVCVCWGRSLLWRFEYWVFWVIWWQGSESVLDGDCRWSVGCTCFSFPPWQELPQRRQNSFNSWDRALSPPRPDCLPGAAHLDFPPCLLPPMRLQWPQVAWVRAPWAPRVHCTPDLGPPAPSRAGAGWVSIAGPARMGQWLQEMSLADATLWVGGLV